MDEHVEKILREIQKNNDDCPSHAFFCPGCKCGHAVWTTGKVAWKFNGSLDKPTFDPSILIHNVTAPDGKIIQPRCHLYVREGQLHFLDDCEHEYKNRVVPMVPF